MKTTSTIFLLVLALSCNISIISAQTNLQDSLALVDLYNSTNGPNWLHHENWLTANPVSTWHGVEIDYFGSRRVQYLWLGDNQLTGSIPSSIGNLVNLMDVDLNSNQLSGNIPPSIGNLVNLTNLSLDYNQLSGSIPSSIGKLVNLSYFGLSFNHLTGSIPSSIGNLGRNVYPFATLRVNLNNNQLSGSIPSSIGHLSTSGGDIYLNLSYNHLSGNIPSSLGNNPADFIELDLSNNRLSGSIPSSLGNQTFLNGLN
jgi:Leucine-rich repeat (LRR) protein